MTPLKVLPALLLTLAAGLAVLVPSAAAATNCAATYGPGYVGTGVPATGDACVNATSAGCWGTFDVGLNGQCFPTDWLDCSRYGPGYVGSDRSADVCVDPTGCPAGTVGVLLNGGPLCVVVGTGDCAARFGPGYSGVRVATAYACVNPGTCPAATPGVGVNGVPECVDSSKCPAQYGPGYAGVAVSNTYACVKLNECSGRSISVDGECVDLTTRRTDCVADYGPGYVGTGLGGRTDACVRRCGGDTIGVELDGEPLCF